MCVATEINYGSETMGKEKRLLMVQASEKTLELLEILAAGNERIAIGPLAKKLCVSRNDALLLLVTLESRGMVRWDERAKVYRPGQKSTELVRQFVSLFGLMVAEPKAVAASRPVAVRPVAPRKLRTDRRLEVGGFAANAP